MRGMTSAAPGPIEFKDVWKPMRAWLAVAASCSLMLLVQGCQVKVESEQVAGPAVIGTAPPAGSEDRGKYVVVKTWYGTDRAPTEPGTFRKTMTDAQKASMKYSGMRGTQGLIFGTATVSIPKEREMGELNGPSYGRREDPTKHIVLLSADELDGDAWVKGVKDVFKDTKAALIYIHGYNVDFRDAARRCAQLSYDLGFQGAPMFYSWPSVGTTTAYPVDEATVEWTVPHLVEFLERAIRETDAEHVFIVAHSMGARATARALEYLQSERDIMKKITAAVFAAPDIDDSVFVTQIAPKISRETKITIYTSEEDVAIRASKFLHYYPRAGGSIADVVLRPDIVTIDASDVDTSFIGHSYFADDAPVIQDIREILEGKPPEDRSRIEKAASGKYWQFKPAD